VALFAQPDPISGPFLVKIDIHIEVPGVNQDAPVYKPRTIFNSNASRKTDHPILFAMPIWGLGRFGSFPSCKTKIKTWCGPPWRSSIYRGEHITGFSN